MAGLARALAHQGCQVKYVVERDLSEDRKRLGWSVPSLEGVQLRFVRHRRDVEECVAAAARDSVHLCQGLRANGLVSYAQRQLARRRYRQWVMMETVDDRGWRGLLKRRIYGRLFKRHSRHIQGVLATGHHTSDWVVARGVPATRVFPFAYFLEDRPAAPIESLSSKKPFCFAFVGRFIHLKRLPMLVNALAALDDRTAELVVVGTGPLEQAWRSDAEQRLPGRIHWMGRQPSSKVLDVLKEVDCLVLPSQHDGWGAVVSEALMSGTPAICSDSCGAATAVLASGVGGVFESDSTADLTGLLADAIVAGKSSVRERSRVSQWSTALGAAAGARYLLAILAHMDGAGSRPLAPWIREIPKCAD